MPQVDLETLVSACAGGTDRKIACETLADNENDDIDDAEYSAGEVAVAGTDYPPESFWLAKDAEFDWFDRNAFYERKESTKGGISHSTSTHVNNPSNSTSTSQRFSINLTSSKPSIIGLPKTQKASYVDGKRRNGTKPANIRLLPRRPAIGKQASTLTEPSSPKVSCMGRVRSKRKSRRSSEPDKKKDKPVVRSKSDEIYKRKTGFGSKFMAIFRSKSSKKLVRTGSSKKAARKDSGKVTESTVEMAPKRSLSVSERVRENPVTTDPEVDPPGLGGMKRFASGRRSTDEFEGVASLDRRVGPTVSS